jgi:hypothetical protein
MSFHVGGVAEAVVSVAFGLVHEDVPGRGESFELPRCAGIFADVGMTFLDPLAIGVADGVLVRVGVHAQGRVERLVHADWRPYGSTCQEPVSRLGPGGKPFCGWGGSVGTWTQTTWRP